MKRLFWIALIGTLLAPAAARAQSDEVVYYHTDAIGSVRMITNSSGVALGRYDYTPFGQEWPTDPPPPSEVRQFAGKELDDTGLNYFGARYYNGQIARFTSVDPIVPVEDALLNPQRWNRYSYALNRPLTVTDPDGRCPQCAMWLQRIADLASRHGQAAYNWATRFFNSPAGQEVTQTVAEVAAGYSGPSIPTLSGNVSKLAKAELETGMRLAQKLGQTLSVSDHVGAEFISQAGKSFDAMGTAAAFANWNPSQFMKSIDRHLLKSVDFVVIDLTGASKSQIGSIQSYVGSLLKEQQAKIMFVGELF